MACCCESNASTRGTNAFFSRFSKRYAKQFRKKGLEKVQRYLLEGVKRESIQGKNIIDIGCGVGSLHLTLLKEGAAQSVGIDISEGMIDQAKKFSSELGVQEKTQYVLGDFVQLADSLHESDITMLDKVVCCYEDLDSLVQTSTAKTKTIYALSHPKENFMMEAFFKLQISLGKLFRWKFIPFWHDWQQMRSNIAAQGFNLIYENSTMAWQVLVYKRA
ncbi:MAG: methyltransferase domain-containing protein [Ignavibacteriales bacterium]|nr:methyltransferase domain-containing protein [Ignavibacteriales bacterium]